VITRYFYTEAMNKIHLYQHNFINHLIKLKNKLGDNFEKSCNFLKDVYLIENISNYSKKFCYLKGIVLKQFFIQDITGYYCGKKLS